MASYNRKSIRLQQHDYSGDGYYFVTVCTKDRECLFGDVIDGSMRLNRMGIVANTYWHQIKEHFKNVHLDECIIMPNHMHGIIVINDKTDIDIRKLNVGAGFPRPLRDGNECHHKRNSDVVGHEGRGNRAPTTLGRIMAYYKYQSTKQINIMHKTPGTCVWQRAFYDHIIRNEKSLHDIREYVINNPSQWEYDENNPNRIAGVETNGNSYETKLSF
ncbi:MAG: transposase [Candidatus Omnitrophica bacterium]|nr:transposase [Candidatus Omnitrophota bacterium]